MRFRSVRIAYVVPPLLAMLLSVVGLLRVDQDGVIGVSTVVTAASGEDAVSNRVIADRIDRVARTHRATIVRVVADRSAPSSRRTVLVTGAPGSSGAEWLRAGYPSFDRSMSTRVRPLAELDRYDPAGPYGVIGDARAAGALDAVLERSGYVTSVEPIGPRARSGIDDGARGGGVLVLAVVLGCSGLCLAGTIGAPRRTAVRRVSGRSTGAILGAELTELRSSAVSLLAAGAVTALVLAPGGRLAFAAEFATAAVAISAALLVPVVVVHVAGVLWTCRVPVGGVLRGARPPSALSVCSFLGRIVASLLLVAAVLDLVGNVAVARSGAAERDLRAAGSAVDLWVTPDPRPGIETQRYWDRIGAFAARGLADGDAMLAASVEIGSGVKGRTTPALFVDAAYLRRQDVRDERGEPVTGGDGRVGVWLPDGSRLRRADVVRSLRSWELRGVPSDQLADVGGGRLGPAPVYTYPGDSTVRTWMDDAVVVVVPDAAGVFSDDQLGAWLSTGDIVFDSPLVADRALARSGLAREFSAVVEVGQDAAERARRAATDVRISAGASTAAAVVDLLLGVLAIVTNRRRHGRQLFVRVAAGVTFFRANAALLVAEVCVLAAAAAFGWKRWWDVRSSGPAGGSALDPLARSAGNGVIAAVLVSLAVGLAMTAFIAVTSARTVRDRGRES